MRSQVRKISSAHRAIAFTIAAAMIAVCAASAFALNIGKLLNNKPKEPDKFAIIRVDRLA
jgi:hypothetical protein